MKPTPPAVRTVRCPRCQGAARYAADNPYRPFCSERCRQHDLGAWASEQYRVSPAEPCEDGLDEPGSSLPPAPH